MTERNRKEQAAAEAEELQKLKSLCSPHIKCFIAAHRNNTTVWPLNPYLFEIPQETKIAFLAILREQGIAFEYHLEYSILDKLLELEMLEQAQEHFNQSFARLKPKLNADDTIEQWANAYVDVFGNNLDYCNDFLQMAQSKGKDTGHHMLVPIHGEIERRARERHVNELKEVLQSGESVSKKTTILDVDLMSGIEFEKFLEKLFSAMGYLVAVTKATGDQGADLVIEKFGEKTAVQAKCYADKVGNYAVQEVLAAKSMYKAHRAMVVTNNYFTDAAKSLATANRIELWDRDKLHVRYTRMINKRQEWKGHL
jgi:restriction endonuclease Mrr